jgi:hypothetical protein
MRIHASLMMGVVTVALLGGCLQRSRDPYQSCVVSADCQNSRDRCLDVVNGTARDSICSSPCSTDSDCPFDRMGALGDCRVLGTGGANCFQACRTSSDCNFGFSCVDPDGSGFPICLPSAGSTPTRVAAFESCISAACDASTDGCTTVQNGGRTTQFCSNNCRTDSDCPFDQRGGQGACFDITGGSMGVCFERCNVSADCNLDAVCTDRTAGGLSLAVPVCLPG